MDERDYGTEKPLKALDCLNGRLELYPDRLVVLRKTWFARPFFRDTAVAHSFNLREGAHIDLNIDDLGFAGYRKLVIHSGGKSVCMVYKHQLYRQAQEFESKLLELTASRDVLDVVRSL